MIRWLKSLPWGRKFYAIKKLNPNIIPITNPKQYEYFIDEIRKPREYNVQNLYQFRVLKRTTKFH
jgi:hemolysin-activating ACP:hemolysin acyltransferase